MSIGRWQPECFKRRNFELSTVLVPDSSVKHVKKKTVLNFVWLANHAFCNEKATIIYCTDLSKKVKLDLF